MQMHSYPPSLSLSLSFWNVILTIMSICTLCNDKIICLCICIRVEAGI